MKIELKRDEHKVKILREMGSRNSQESLAAQEAFAAFVGPIVQQVLDQLASSSLIYQTYEYDFDTMPSIPLDLFEDNDEGLIDIWSQSIAGGLPTNLVHGLDDFRVTTYRLDSAVSWYKRYARDARLDVAALVIKRMAQEILAKQERNAYAPLLKALADSNKFDGKAHLIDATTENVFQVDDLNRAWTMVKRINSAWTNGTPTATPSRGLTDMLISPEIAESIRSLAYNPANTRAYPDNAESTALGLPDDVRSDLYRNAGSMEIFGVNFIELLELGVGQSYSVLFDSFYTAGSGEPAFAVGADEIAIGLDLGQDFAIRVAERDPDIDSTVTTLVDDQFVARSEKIGNYSMVTEGRAVTSNKAICGVIV